DDGVALDAAAELSRAISAALDDRGDDILRGRSYTLQVTSPGTDRPLTRPRHFRRAAGRSVRLTLHGGGTRAGRILRLDGDALVLLGGADGLAEEAVPLADIERG